MKDARVFCKDASYDFEKCIIDPVVTGMDPSSL